eukprot:Phypoly_transcript_04656.p1 GENE.Phypoly_transcript_04656~~Phypoly_transcript_04656.p1  ORF type:complete len:624 (+),score=80.36 Phypoly_transcript_04656:134-2005(+)
MKKVSPLNLNYLEPDYKAPPATDFSSNDLEKELLALDAKIQNIPSPPGKSITTSATDFTYYETESDDEEVSSDSEDEIDVFQLPKVYDAKDIDAEHLIDIQASCRGFLARRMYKNRVTLRKERSIHVNELASSEAVFVLSLQYLCTYFLAPLKEEGFCKDDKIAQSMFSTLEELRTADMDWLQSLQVLAANWNSASEIGPDADKLQSDFLPIYNFYCSNYLHMIHWLQQQHNKNPAFLRLEKRCGEELQRNTTIATNLQVLLSLPLTNLRTYHSIFERMLECTELDHIDYPKIQKCIAQLKDVANLAATSVKDIENKQKILAMEETLVGELPVKTWVAPTRIFIMEGTLTKLCRKVAKRRHFWLLSDCLIYGIPTSSKEKEKEKEKDSDSSALASSSGSIEKKQYKFRRMLPLENSKFLDLADDPSRQPHAFQIVTGPKSFIVFANSHEQKSEWLTAHNTALNIISSRGTAVKVKTDTNELAPIWLHDNMSNNCMICRKTFTVVKRRHHCRKCGRLVCASCSQKKMMLSNLGKAKRVCDECGKILLTGSTDGKEFKNSQELQKQDSMHIEGIVGQTPSEPTLEQPSSPKSPKSPKTPKGGTLRKGTLSLRGSKGLLRLSLNST